MTAEAVRFNRNISLISIIGPSFGLPLSSSRDCKSGQHSTHATKSDPPPRDHCKQIIDINNTRFIEISIAAWAATKGFEGGEKILHIHKAITCDITSPALPVMRTSAWWSIGVSLRLTMASLAPDCSASMGT